MFFALCLLTAACADAEKPPKGAVTLIYMIGDGLGLAQVSMPVIGGGYVPKAFDRAQGAALIRTRRKRPNAFRRLRIRSKSALSIACRCGNESCSCCPKNGGKCWEAAKMPN